MKAGGMLRLCFSSPAASLRTTTTLVACTRCKLAVTTAVPATSHPSTLCISRRYQRSGSTRVRTSSWEEKTRKFEERQREQQEEAARAARRRARYVSSASSSSSASSAFTPAADMEVEKEVRSSSSSSTTASPTAPSTGLWDFIKGGSKGRRSQPLNPLMHLERIKKGSSPFDPDARAAQRVIDAVNGLRRRNSRRRGPMSLQLSDDEKQGIVNRYAETQWYAALYRPFRNITERQIRWTLRLAHVGMILLLFGFLIVVFVVYAKEMDTVARLSPEDQRDYAHMVQGMRYSDIYYAGKRVLESDDPLEALPPEVRLHMALDACREKNWHKMDWNVELRKMHPDSALEEHDWIHIFYWVVMEVGRAIGGGGGLFNDRVLDVREVRQGNAESPEERDRFVEMEPTALPTKTKRGFFS